MKRIFVVITLLAITLGTGAQNMGFSICDGIQEKIVRQRVERGVTCLLNEFNYACAQQRSLQLDSVDM